MINISFYTLNQVVYSKVYMSIYPNESKGLLSYESGLVDLSTHGGIIKFEFSLLKILKSTRKADFHKITCLYLFNRNYSISNRYDEFWNALTQSNFLF